MTTPSPLTLDDLILARLRVVGDVGMVRSELDKTLQPIGTQQHSSAEWKRILATVLERVLGHGLVEPAGRSRLILTAAGQGTLADRVGVLVTGGRMRWDRLRNTFLMAKALALPVPTTEAQQGRLMAGDGLRAAILWSHYQLPFTDYPTLTAARDRLMWRHLLSEGTTARLAHQETLAAAPFTQGTLMAALLNDLLEAKRGLDWPAALEQLVAKRVGARRTTPDALRIAILAQASTSEAADTPVPPTSTSEGKAIDYPAFAAAVVQAAKRCQTGRFGTHKIFISHVWQQLREEGRDQGLDLDTFKQQLVEAMRRGLISLSRADMSYALDQADVAASSIAHLTDTLHFVRLD
jgi:hypothetical protein